MSDNPDNLRQLDQRGRALIEQQMRVEGRQVYDLQGSWAFANPRRVAVTHEIGHGIVNEVHGIETESIEVFERSRWHRDRELKKEKKQLRKRGVVFREADFDWVREIPAWCGWCMATVSERDKADKNARFSFRPDDPLCNSMDHLRRIVRYQIAGFMSEVVFFEDDDKGRGFPMGSSLDEKLIAQNLCGNFGDPHTEWQRLMIETGYMLKTNASVVLELIAAMEHVNKLEGKPLRAIFSKVDRGTWHKRLREADNLIRQPARQ